MLNKKRLLKLINNNLSLIFILIFSITIAVLSIYINSTENILGDSYRDVFFYLIESLRMSGIGIDGYDYVNFLSPLIPFLCSILFRFGFVSINSIFVITGIFYILGVLGIFLLFKLRFNNYISLFSAIFFGSSSLVLIWTGNGTIDVPSVSLTILTFYFMILSFEKNQNYFILAFPLAILSFFAKYTAGLLFPLILLYFLFKGNLKENIKKYFKKGFLGIVCGVITAIPFALYFYINKIPLGFIEQAETIGTSVKTTIKLQNDVFYYIGNISKFIYNPNHIISYIFIVILVIGTVICIYEIIKYFKNIAKNKNKYLFYYYFIIILAIANVIFSFLIVNQISFKYCEINFFLTTVILSIAFNKLNSKLDTKNKKIYKCFSFDLLMICWFTSYMIFFSSHLIKVDRYFITMMPGLTFLVATSLNKILVNLDSKLNLKINLVNITINKHVFTKIISLILIILLLITSFSYLTIDKRSELAENEKDASEWIKSHDNNYKNVVIYADRGPIFTWYLQKEVVYMGSNVPTHDLNNILKSNNTTYYISIEKYDLFDYNLVKTFGQVYIYEIKD
ncbi:glycosyltransferase family 39 protein [Methanobrevibacter filiformis]|uniref:Glycosyltransferase RgtA/B/C/D-like domain-containing protein n=1 Tax=Methanobrevibacter filiformis TaxID=55758 RepID=A0A166EZJ1_9EURY|nr:glycosyltransferase family 39 protein [Methanobrevibacter filiformis]KZX17171.1 hypothetical protein MBFIL_03220 [Methanobrevibacter filiformis]